MKHMSSISEMQSFADDCRRRGKTIGFVPTMGFLHEGHLSLVRLAAENADVVVTSVFVNPAQFGPNEDFKEYPRDLARDERLAEEAGTDVLFVPPADEMYAPDFQTTIRVEKVTEPLCGRSRPWHFQGVTTVVAKLFHIVKPHIAVFGQKDAQQLVVIQQMVRDLNMDIQIIPGPIIRESDGLAMSSRNKYLSAKERSDALVLHAALQQAATLIRNGERTVDAVKKAMIQLIQQKPSAKIDYVDIVDFGNLQPLSRVEGNVLIAVAVFIGKTRLIDNIALAVET